MTQTPRPQTRANGNRTRARILDAAERLFGAHGFDAISLREITDSAGVTLALASYHFGTKENLFEEVVSRRAGILSRLRTDRLSTIEEPTAEAILDAFMAPMFEKALSKEAGWSDYFRVLARMGESNRWLDCLRRNFDETAQTYIRAMVAALPGADPNAVTRAFTMTLQIMLATISQNERVDGLSGGKVKARNLKAAYDALLVYATAGVLALTR
ncbi:MAG: TetR family transcriptional regulator [Rhodobacteraceae bacterium]|nr:TetR family transcriptional regulator [Paracoccaceae bacterium]